MSAHSAGEESGHDAPIPAIRQLLDTVGGTAGDVGTCRDQQAFAVVACSAERNRNTGEMTSMVGACELANHIGGHRVRDDSMTLRCRLGTPKT